MRHAKPNRREALEAAGLALLANQARAADREMPYRTLGNTGQKVSCIGMGGSHIGKPSLTNVEAIRLIREALDRGMNFMDNSWDYNKGDSEVRMGNALKDGYRQKAFLMTKFDEAMDGAPRMYGARLGGGVSAFPQESPSTVPKGRRRLNVLTMHRSAAVGCRILLHRRGGVENGARFPQSVELRH
jgi:hypothetical protein